MEKICQKCLKVAKYSAKVALVAWELMQRAVEAARHNECMGNTGGCMWGVSVVLEHTERAVRNV